MGSLIAIVTAMGCEAAQIRRLLHRAPWGASVTLCVSGMGKESATQCVAGLAAESRPPDMLLSLGSAGATREETIPGDLLLSASVHALEEGAFAADQVLLDLAQEACKDAGLHYWVEDSLTVPGPVYKRDDKSRLGGTTGAWAINMEDYWLAAEAAKANIPFLAVRAILDTTDQDLPPFAGDWEARGVAGQVATTLQTLALRPWLLPSLVTLGRQAHRAQRNLATFSEIFLPQAVMMRPREPAQSVQHER